MTLAFQEGDQILCFHGPLLYEAKVLKAENWVGKEGQEDGQYYFVHYKGWKQTWDEWVPESRVLKYSEDNLKKQADLKESLKSKKAKESKRQQEKEGDKNRKRPRESTAEREEEFLRRPEIKISIPESLKSQLIEDWENVTKSQKLVRLPREVNVVDVLQRYRESLKEGKGKKGAKEGDDDIVQEVLDGIVLYFERALGNLLLYRFERQQYVEMKKKFPDKSMAELYGAEHLLRLFVNFPTLLAHTNMEPEAVDMLKDQFTQILEWMQAHQQQLFLAEYDNVSPTYIAQMKASS
ncbi:uncharacterized protein SPPG_04248 [Spizellomyces punctatus DAOM BR117]|uniref:Chromatin modification-related protein EAF3 n=1 Tax=Spizellomyces punctatus (strain DAOM BR117) TaxID=645134 RepID=A0A0L0HJ77_SPIPD|nr:uncharacterized protein SPPG_04248 [Spizellomyces punctatus DAOM BR117]KND01157.1 hypothetical protein SPPG_04248 [Spizellomyces punctatus DAOM BR117]|eukprot:XP_016609196.1 hypothetical protein SPPG_04248 [Spizellomyces punctatus DAOM BR117]